MPVTIKQIAEASGFSVPTVSQVLNNKGHLYRAETRQRILDIARELGYRPNSYRWALRTGRFNNIGVLTLQREEGDPLLTDACAGILDVLARRDMHLTVGALLNDREEPPAEASTDLSTPKMLREWSVDGLIIHRCHPLPRYILNLITEHAIPCVWLNDRHRRNSVYADRRGGTKQAVQSLVQMGHKHIGFLTSGEGRPDEMGDCWLGYRDAIESAQLKPMDLRATQRFTGPQRRAFCLALLEANNRPTALITADSRSAVTALHAACELQLRVPEDLSIIGVGSRRIDCAGVNVDTLLIDAAALGREAATMLLARVDRPKKSLPSQAIPLQLLDGETTAPPS